MTPLIWFLLGTPAAIGFMYLQIRDWGRVTSGDVVSATVACVMGPFSLSCVFVLLLMGLADSNFVLWEKKE